MRLAGIKRISLILGLSLYNIFLCSAYAQEVTDFAWVMADDINVRSDSTTTSEIICKVNKGDNVEVVLELYDWYKIRLPKNAPAFVKKEFVVIIDDKTAKIREDSVNIRLRPDTSSPILGEVNKDEVIKILGETQGWYKIEPLNHSFGWIHKQFVKKTELPQ